MLSDDPWQVVNAAPNDKYRPRVAPPVRCSGAEFYSLNARLETILLTVLLGFLVLKISFLFPLNLAIPDLARQPSRPDPHRRTMSLR